MERAKELAFRLDLFLKVPFLRHWKAKDIQPLIYPFELRTCRRGHWIIREGEDTNYVYMVRAGTFKVLKHMKHYEGGRQVHSRHVEVAYVSTGEMLGLDCINVGGEITMNNVSVCCDSDTGELYMALRKPFHDRLAQDPKSVENLTAFVKLKRGVVEDRVNSLRRNVPGNTSKHNMVESFFKRRERQANAHAVKRKSEAHNITLPLAGDTTHQRRKKVSLIVPLPRGPSLPSHEPILSSARQNHAHASASVLLEPSRSPTAQGMVITSKTPWWIKGEAPKNLHITGDFKGDPSLAGMRICMGTARPATTMRVSNAELGIGILGETLRSPWRAEKKRAALPRISNLNTLIDRMKRRYSNDTIYLLSPEKNHSTLDIPQQEKTTARTTSPRWQTNSCFGPDEFRTTFAPKRMGNPAPRTRFSAVVESIQEPGALFTKTVMLNNREALLTS
jgi:CRP-like cAMP-binding protein